MKNLLISLSAALPLLFCACGDDSAAGAGGGGGSGAGAPPCVENPQTHLEIINACTDAQAIAKDPVLPLLNADGSLPPLP